MQTIGQWLEDLGLSQYAEVFERNAVDLDIARDLTQQDLRDLGVEPLGHRKVLLRAIVELNGPEARAAKAQHVQHRFPAEPSLPTEAERRQLTVLFCDLAGSTELAARLDPEELREVLRAYQATCASGIAKFDGHIAQYLGDGLLVYFGYPRAHEDDAERAVRTGLAIVAAIRALNASASGRTDVRLAVRVGIHTGLVVVGEVGVGAKQEQLALGETPNLAARLQALAEPDAVVISGSTQRLVRGLFRIVDLGTQALKGAPGPMPVYQVIGESAAQSRMDVAMTTGFTRLIGREREVGLLLDRWEQIAEGHGEAVLLTGEAGIGKSRLVQVLKDRIARTPHTLLECRCSPYYQHTQLHPIVDLFPRVFEWAADEAPEVKLRKLQSHMAQYAVSAEEIVPLLASLLSLPPADGYPSTAMSPERQRKKTIEGLIALFLAMASERPVLLIVDDLHWVDPSTMELLSHLLDQIPTARLLVLLIARPAFRPPWTARSYLTVLNLNRFTREQTELMIDQVAGGKTLPVEVVQQIVAKTDGVPLFVEELTKMVQESGLLTERADRYELRGPLAPLSIPATLQDSLMARLDRLASVKAVAQLGATLGREFSYELLRAVSQLDDAPLHQGLAGLVDAELLYQRGVLPHATYVFKHALIQDAAYQSVLKSSRQQSHQRIAQVLEARLPETRDARPELLAHHYTEAGLVAQAALWWQRAGQRAVAHSAHVEAISHLTKGLELAATLPAARERSEQELALLNTLGLALFAVKGQASEEVGRTHARAREICREIGETPFLPSILGGLFSFHVVRAELRAAWEVAEQLLGLAQHQHDPARLSVAHLALGETLLFRGEFAQARAHLEQGIALYTVQPNQPLSLLSGFPVDLGVFDLCFLAHTLWHLGYPDQARSKIQQALGLAEALAHPLSLALARDYEAMLYQFRREAHRVHASADMAISLCTEQGFAYYLAWGTLMRGWALREQGQDEVGMAQVREGLAAIRATGAELRLPYYLALLAEVRGKTDHADDALALLSEALARVDRTGEHWVAAELHRLKGELLLHHAHRADEAEESMRYALDIARAQGARSLELRAGVSLGRLWQRQGKGAQARGLVTEIHSWFTEGFDTVDMQEAKALLDALG